MMVIQLADIWSLNIPKRVFVKITLQTQEVMIGEVVTLATKESADSEDDMLVLDVDGRFNEILQYEISDIEVITKEEFEQARQ